MSAWLPSEDRNLNETCGSWEAEHEAEEALVAFLERTALFRIYRQLAGSPLSQHHFQDRNSLRADLFLLPKRELVTAGWTGGAVVIEVKRSGERIGPGCSQLLDYMNAAWTVAGCVSVVPTFGFLFPAYKQHGPIASIMAQQHIGTASIERDGLAFYCGESNVFSISATGKLHLGTTAFGRKLGAR